jgi:hypothetical protein
MHHLGPGGWGRHVTDLALGRGPVGALPGAQAGGLAPHGGDHRGQPPVAAGKQGLDNAPAVAFGAQVDSLGLESLCQQLEAFLGLGPHRIGNPAARPAWFYEKAKYGGILCDIGSHQFEQFLTFTGATDATVTQAAVGNFNNPDKPELEDFGEASLLGNNGTSNYIRVDWLNPTGLSTWGDGRMVILGTKGYIELRKYVDVGRDKTGDHVYIVDDKGEQHLEVAGKVGFKFFGQLILDCLNRTEKAMTQAHTFKAAELCLRAQMAARRITP